MLDNTLQPCSNPIVAVYSWLWIEINAELPSPQTHKPYLRLPSSVVLGIHFCQQR